MNKERLKIFLERCVLADSLIQSLRSEGVLSINDGSVHMSHEDFLELFPDYLVRELGEVKYPYELSEEYCGITFLTLLTKEEWDLLQERKSA